MIGNASVSCKRAVVSFVRVSCPGVERAELALGGFRSAKPVFGQARRAAGPVHGWVRRAVRQRPDAQRTSGWTRLRREHRAAPCAAGRPSTGRMRLVQKISREGAEVGRHRWYRKENPPRERINMDRSTWSTGLAVDDIKGSRNFRAFRRKGTKVGLAQSLLRKRRNGERIGAWWPSGRRQRRIINDSTPTPEQAGAHGARCRVAVSKMLLAVVEGSAKTSRHFPRDRSACVGPFKKWRRQT
jgi:hypothetical protein